MLGILTVTASLSFAEESQQGYGDDEAQAPQHKGSGFSQSSGMMNPMMMMTMMKPSVTPTSDGGVVVLAGPKLTKYDKDMNLVKEVDLSKSGPGKKSPPGESAQ